MNDIAEVWSTNTWKEFMTKNPFQYKPERERKVEFDRIPLEWVTLGRQAEYEVESLRGIMVAHEAARQPQPTVGPGITQATPPNKT